MTGLQIKKGTGFLYITALLLAVAVTGVYFPHWGNTLLLVAIPAVALFVKGVFFEKLKLGTLIVGRILISLAAFALFPGEWLALIVVWLLRINILEAVIQDFSRKNIFNALSGLVLIATSFWMTTSWNGTWYLVDQEAYLWWIIAYTIWNWDFVNLQFSTSISLLHLGVLGAPLVWMGVTGSSGFWLIMRGATLIFAVTNQILFKEELEKILAIPAWDRIACLTRKIPVQAVMLGVNIVLCGISVWLLMAGR